MQRSQHSRLFLVCAVAISLELAIGSIWLVPSIGPVVAQVAATVQPHHDVQTGPVGPPQVPSGPLVVPPGIPSPNDVPRVVRPRTAGSDTVDLKVLVLSADGTESDLGAIKQALDFLGTPYDVFQGAPVPAAGTDRLAARLSDGVQHAYYQGVILTTSVLSYNNGSSFVSALTNTEWQSLHTYEARFSIRQISWYTYPNADYGFQMPSSAGSAPISVPFTAAGQATFGSYANTNTPLAISNVYTYMAQPLNDGKTQALLSDGAGNALAAIRTYADGRQNLALTFDSNQYLTHDLVLSYGLINWVTQGLFLGERHIYQLTQPDDLFIQDDIWPVGQACGSSTSTGVVYRIVGTDLNGVINWQNTVQTRSTTGQFRLEIPFNGQGATSGYPARPNPDTLTAAVMAGTNKAQFAWLSHTYDHNDLDNVTYAQATDEIVKNNQIATMLGLPDYSPQNILTPGITGLTNTQFLQAAYDNGIRYIISDTSKAGYTNPSPNAGVYNSFQPTMLMIPRHPVNLYYNVSTPDQWLAEDNCLYPTGQYGHVDTYAQLLDRESSVLLTYLLKGDIDPLMFHQTNLREYDHAGHPNQSLLSDLLDATFAKYNAVFKLPIVTLKTDTLGARMADRMAYNAAGVSAKIIQGPSGPGSVTLTAQKAAKVPLTGFTASMTCVTCTVETYAGQSITYVTLNAGQSITLYAAPRLAGISPSSGPTSGQTSVTLTGAGFQSDATVKINGNPCTGVTVVDSAVLTCTAPAGPTGMADISVTTAGSQMTLSKAYSYVSTAPSQHTAAPTSIAAPQSQPSIKPLATLAPGMPTPLPQPVRH